MSTPPRIDLPDGVVRERWPVRGADHAVLRTTLESTESWAVLVPGFTGSKEDFIAVLPLLASAGVGAVAYDQLGQFESGSTTDPGDYALDSLAADLGTLIDVAASRFGRADAPHLLGHSFGGLVCQRALIAGDAMPRSFVALCSGPGALPEERWRGLPDLVTALSQSTLAEIWRRIGELDAAAGRPSPPPQIRDFLERRWLANSPVQLRQAALALMEQPSMTEALRMRVASGLPTTVMWGELDDAWPIAVQARWASDLGATARQIPGAGHSPNADRPGVLVQHLAEAWHL